MFNNWNPFKVVTYESNSRDGLSRVRRGIVLSRGLVAIVALVGFVLMTNAVFAGRFEAAQTARVPQRIEPVEIPLLSWAPEWDCDGGLSRVMTCQTPSYVTPRMKVVIVFGETHAVVFALPLEKTITNDTQPSLTVGKTPSPYPTVTSANQIPVR